MTQLSVIMPARNEVYLEKTIQNVLDNIRGDTEIIVMLDGYVPDPQIVTNDDRVRFVHKKEPIGQRACINEAARLSEATYIMKLDAHCAVDEGFDVKLMSDTQPEWTVVPRMYNLDIETWEPKLHKRTDYMYIGWNDKDELRALYYSGNDWKQWHRREELIDDTMACMGPGWFLRRDRFFEYGGCDEAHGSWGQQGIEVACKTWLSGGALKVNKKTWFAHWFRGGGGPGFPYPLPGNAVNRARDYSKDLWLNDKWPQATRKFQFLLDKFDPPTWKERAIVNESKKKADELNVFFYHHSHVLKHEPKWKGTTVIKMPSDLMLYHKVIWENKPHFIIDSGTKYGGSALFFQDMLDMVGNGGKVISIDKYPLDIVKDPRITYLTGNSIGKKVLGEVKDIVGDGSVMVVLDSNHSRVHVKWELHRYAPIVTTGQYMVVEDCFSRKGVLAGPGEARNWFLKVNKEFKQTNLDQEYIIGYCRGGWLIKQ